MYTGADQTITLNIVKYTMTEAGADAAPCPTVEVTVDKGDFGPDATFAETGTGHDELTIALDSSTEYGSFTITLNYEVEG